MDAVPDSHTDHGAGSPSHGVPNHDGTAADPAQRFFGPPLETVTGRLRSATSTRREGDEVHLRWSQRFRETGGAAAIGAASAALVLATLAYLLHLPLADGLLVAVFGLGVVLTVAYGFTRPETYTCSFLGDEGLVLHELQGDQTSTQLFCFGDADKVWSDVQDLHDEAETYLHSTLRVWWFRDEEKVFSLAGDFDKRDSTHPTDSQVHLCTAALAAYREHRARRRRVRVPAD